MTTTYTPVSTAWAATIPLPEDGVDSVNAASVSGMQDIADNVKHLRDGTASFTGAKSFAGDMTVASCPTYSPARSVTIALPVVALPPADAARWDPVSSGYWVQSYIDNVYYLYIVGTIPFVGTITSIRIRVNGKCGGTSHSDMPVTMPTALFEIYDTDYAALGSGTADDLSINLTNYEQIHSMAATVSVAVDRRCRIRVALTGERGTNAIAGCFGVIGVDAVVSLLEV